MSLRLCLGTLILACLDFLPDLWGTYSIYSMNYGDVECPQPHPNGVLRIPVKATMSLPSS